MLQGDWIVPSSREAIDQGSSWNQWLREEGLPALFASAVSTVVTRCEPLVSPGATSGAPSAAVDAATSLFETLLRVIPLPGSVTDFFAPAVPPLLARLSTTVFVPTQCGRFVPPSQTLLPAPPSVEGDPAVDAAVAATTSRVARWLGLCVVSPLIRFPRDAAASLGVRRADAAATLADMLCAVGPMAESSGDGDGPLDAPWLEWCIEALAADATHLSPHLPRLARARFLPLACGGVAAPDNGVFQAPPSSSEDIDALLPLLPGARVLSHQLQAAAAARRGLAKGLARLGVTVVEGPRFVELHILPALASASTPPTALPRLLAFARRHGRSSGGIGGGGGGDVDAALAASLAAAGARLLLADGGAAPCGRGADVVRFSPGALAPHVPPSASPPPSLAPPRWRFVDADAYAAQPCAGGAAGWARFLAHIGVEWFVTVDAAPTTTHSAPSELRGEWQAPLEELLRGSNTAGGEAVIRVDDYSCADLGVMCEAAASAADASTCAALLACVAHHWPALRHAAVATLTLHTPPLSSSAQPAAPRSVRVPSSLALSMRAHAWLPCEDGRLRPGESVFAGASLRRVLGGHGPWLAPLPATSSALLAPDLLEALGVRAHLSPLQLLRHIETVWAAGGEDFISTLDQQAAVYALLASSADGGGPGFAEQLRSVSWVWVPLLSSAKPAQPKKGGGLDPIGAKTSVAGRFHRAADCALSDPSGLIDALGKNTVSADMLALGAASGCRVLDRFYGSIGNASPGGAALAVLASLGVPPAPATRHYIAVLDACAAEENSGSANVTAAFRILCNWAYTAGASSDGDEEEEEEEEEEEVEEAARGLSRRAARLLASLSGHAAFPTAAGGWATPEQLRFWDDTRPPGRVSTPSAGSMPHALSAASLAAAAAMRAPAGGVVKDLGENLRRFYGSVLRLPALSTAASETAVASGVAPPPLPASRHPPLRVVAAVLQRWSAAALEPPARARLRAALAAVRVVRCAAVAPHLRLRGRTAAAAAAAASAPSPPAHADADHSLLPSEPIVVAAPLSVFLDTSGAADGPTDAPPILYVVDTPASAAIPHAPQASALASQLGKLLPRGAASSAQAVSLLASALSSHGSASSRGCDAFCDAQGLPPRPADEPHAWLGEPSCAEGSDEDGLAAESSGSGIAAQPPPTPPHMELLLGALATRSAPPPPPPSDGGAAGDGIAAANVLRLAVEALRARKPPPPNKGGRSAVPGVLPGRSASATGGQRLNEPLLPPTQPPPTPTQLRPQLPPCASAAGRAAAFNASSSGPLPHGGQGGAHPPAVWTPRESEAPISWETMDAVSASAGGGPAAAQLASLLAQSHAADDGGDAAQAAVGRAGEAFMFSLLQRLPEHAGRRVVWLNEAAERGQPYDIEVVSPPAGGRPANRVYVEVKATSSARRFFDVSVSELEWARVHGERYHIYHVCRDAAATDEEGRAALRVSRIVDPVAALTFGGARLFFFSDVD